uniref:Uncharacterized protein n=1 Tax=Salix viminalis TaxID=40686 RepID=A0A6N2N628_SALVM
METTFLSTKLPSSARLHLGFKSTAHHHCHRLLPFFALTMTFSLKFSFESSLLIPLTFTTIHSVSVMDATSRPAVVIDNGSGYCLFFDSASCLIKCLIFINVTKMGCGISSSKRSFLINRELLLRKQLACTT